MEITTKDERRERGGRDARLLTDRRHPHDPGEFNARLLGRRFQKGRRLLGQHAGSGLTAT